MTIPETACLVLQSPAIGEGGQVWVLDMGAPVRIASLDDRSKDVTQLIDWAIAHPVASDAEVRIELARLVTEYRPAGRS